MFEKIKQKLQNESYKQILLVTSLMIISRFFGFIRQSLIASSYISDGSTLYSDMFINAQKIQDTLISFLVMGTLISTLSPRGAKILAKEGEKKFNDYTRFTFWIFMGFYMIIAILCAIFVEDILKVTFGKFYLETATKGVLNTFVDSSRVLCFGVVFFAANTLLQTYLNLKNSFFWNNLSGIITNIFIIFAILNSPKNFVLPVSIALVLSFIIGVFVHLYASGRVGLKWNFFNIEQVFKQFHEFKNYLKEDIIILLPKILIVPVVSIASLIVSYLGGQGQPTYFETSSMIQGIFLTLIGAFGMVILPKLSHSLHIDGSDVFIEKINNYLRKFVPITFLGSVFTALLAPFLLTIVLSAGTIKKGNFSFVKFGDVENLQVRLIQILAAGIVFLAINEILIKYFLVKNLVKKLFIINTISIILLISLVYYIRHTFNLESSIAVAIALTLTTVFQSFMYYIFIIFDKNEVKKKNISQKYGDERKLN
jgi:peptidoglycan biosynthesis protein MviN/MurJ (putative lipid II flippase)